MAGKAKAGRGLVKIFPVEKLIRPANGLARHADDAAAKASRRGTKAARKAGPSNRVIHQQQAWKQAADERDRLHRELADQGPRAVKEHKTVTGCTDPETGLSAGGHSSPAGGRWGCAEKNALDNLNAKRAERGLDPLEPHQVDYCKAAKTSTSGPPSSEMPICKTYCQEQTTPDQFPNGTKYYGSDGVSESPWDQLASGRRG